jgi:hypothetical protein
MEPSEYLVDPELITADEAVDYIDGLSGRDRTNHRRIQAWFDHCARIRRNPSSLIALAERHPGL